MKKVLVSVIAAASALAPVTVFAQGADNFQATVNQLMVVAAALEAQATALQDNQPLACALIFSKPSVHLHESVALAWGSVGAIDPEVSSTSRPMWAPHGVSALVFDKTGTWKYSFSFYSDSGASTTCEALIRVVQ